MAMVFGRGIPRRKSCSACVKAKRRCDFAVPTCLRCSNRDISCDYPERIRSSISRMRLCQAISPNPVDTGNEIIEDLASPPSLEASLMDDLESGATLGAASWQASDCDAVVPSNSIQSSYIDFTRPEPRDGDFDGCGNGGEIILLDHGEASSSLGLNTPTPTTPGSIPKPLSAAISERIQFAIKYLSDIPKALVKTLELPWCHTEIFKREMPWCLQGASCLRSRRGYR